MDKQNKLASELKNVDPQSGKLRFLLLIVFTFILWTLLAFIVSVADPFSTLTPLWPFETHSTSSTLASSLLNDIVGNYLSIYAIVYLAFFLLSILASFLIARSLLSKMLQLDSSKPVGKFLTSCGFALSNYPVFDANADKFTNSDKSTILTALGGPAFLAMPKHYLALISNRTSEIQSLFIDQTSNELFFIDYGERLSNLICSKERQTVKTIHALCRDGSKALVKNLRITYSLNAKCFENGSGKYALACKEISSFNQGNEIEAFIEEFLRFELKSILLNYSHLEIQEMFEKEPGKLAQPNPVSKGSDKKHNVRSHNRRYDASRGRAAQNGNGIIFRNRRRSILPEMRILEEKKIEANKDIEANLDFKDRLSIKLSQSVNSLFSTPIININIEELGKVSFDGIY